jgi:hypothetical protein
MLIPLHHTDRVVTVQPESFVGDPWTTEVVPRLPATLAAQARALKAFPRVCGVATPTDLLRALRCKRLRLGRFFRGGSAPMRDVIIDAFVERHHPTTRAAGESRPGQAGSAAAAQAPPRMSCVGRGQAQALHRQ